MTAARNTHGADFRHLAGIPSSPDELVGPREDGGAGMQILRVSASSRPKSVAGALAAILKESGPVEMQAVGAAAINQAVKAMAIARGFLSASHMDLVAIPEFIEVDIDGETRTAMRFTVEPRG